MMKEFWMIGPTAAALFLRARGFSPCEAERLVALKRRYDRQAAEALAQEGKRLRFARWLVSRGRLTEELPAPGWELQRRAA